ncbi:MAG: RdgB/HAM1 family non-canonical purine NTP pyrophosphatase [Candidatus Pacebacteria bacterium]|nr:RdgB/HAM1 family non-canonical purine NTP pyrophosphatase [Candidatus Paceibacterota bacterium]
MKLLIATNNKGKQKEFIKVLAGLNYDILLPADLNLEDLEVAETGKTARDNALLKAREFAHKTGLLTVADDSGLEIDALDGAPGIHSKRFQIGSDEDRNKKILELLDNVKNRSAIFRSVLCLFDPISEKVEYFEGIFKGSIALTQIGRDGFGYDPIFIPFGETKSVAELGIDYKNEHSHRAIAIKKLKTFLDN